MNLEPADLILGNCFGGEGTSFKWNIYDFKIYKGRLLGYNELFSNFF